MGVLGKHVGNAYNTMSTVSSAFGLLGQKLSRTQTISGIEEIKKLEE